MEKISSHTQQKLHWGNDDLDIATVVKLQIMKINTILSMNRFLWLLLLALFPITLYYYAVMSNTLFSQKEVEYLKSQRLARVATAAVTSLSETRKSVQPDVVPVGFDFDGDYFYVGGMNLPKSTKYKNVLRNNKVAIVIDDLKTVDPWDPRGMKIYGDTDIVTRQGGYMDGTGHSNPQYIRINPKKKWSWGIDEPIFVEGRFNVKRAGES